jgi:cellulose biosynthesis protein BcsQ
MSKNITKDRKSQNLHLPRTLEEFAELFEYLFPEHDFTWKSYSTRWIALCPFHSERNPSFNIYEQDGKLFYKCFSCGETGSVFTLLSKFNLLFNSEDEKEHRQEYKQYTKRIELAEDFVTLAYKEFERFVKGEKDNSGINLGEENEYVEVFLRKVKPAYFPTKIKKYGMDEKQYLLGKINYFKIGIVTERVVEEYIKKSDEHREFFRNELEPKLRVYDRIGYFVFPYYSSKGTLTSFKLRDLNDSSRTSRVFKVLNKKGVFGGYGAVKYVFEDRDSKIRFRFPFCAVTEGETDAISLAYAGVVPVIAVGSASNYSVLLSEFKLSEFKFSTKLGYVPIIFPDFDPMSVESAGAGIDALFRLEQERKKIYRETGNFEKIFVLCDRIAYAGKKDINEALKISRIEDILCCRIEELKEANKIFRDEWNRYKIEEYKKLKDKLERELSPELAKVYAKTLGIKEILEKKKFVVNLADLYERDDSEYPEPILGRFPVRCISVIASFGGIGKTTFALITALRIARDEGLRILFWTTEHEEISFVRKIHQICNLPEFWDGGEENRKKIKEIMRNIDIRFTAPEPFFTVTSRGKARLNDVAFEEFRTLFEEYDVVIIDPFLSFSGLEENDNSNTRRIFDKLHTILRSFEDERKALIILHHFNKDAIRNVNLKEDDVKVNNEEIEIDYDAVLSLYGAVRGASSIVESSRYVEAIVKIEEKRYCVTVKTNENTRRMGKGEIIPELFSIQEKELERIEEIEDEEVGDICL